LSEDNQKPKFLSKRRKPRFGKGRPRDRDRRSRKRVPAQEWIPKTALGQAVKNGDIMLEDIWANNYRVLEKEIFDMLIPNLKETVVDISMVQKQTDSGQQSRFKAIVCVGNEEGYVGLATSKAREVGPGIRKAISSAKLNIISVKRGCGSWECNCGGNHSIPYVVQGKCGSVKVTLKPAPKGTGLVASDVAKIPLSLAGIKDCYVFIKGNSKNAENTAKAVIDALKNAYKIMSPKEWGI